MNRFIERRHWWVLHKHFVTVALPKHFTADMVLLVLFNAAGNRVFPFGFQYIFIRRAFRAVRRFGDRHGVASAQNVVHFPDILARV